MLRRNEIWLGIILGIIIPFVGYALLLTAYENFDLWGWASNDQLSPDFRTRTLGLLAISLNLIPFALYNRLRYVSTMRGLIFPTMVYVVIWFVRFGVHLIA
ncbi:MAG: hypothetical protein HKN16_09890 [Saprospiraceae bacterium]|nr:hypothetical protein [Saprospiraceae bacterium]